MNTVSVMSENFRRAVKWAAFAASTDKHTLPVLQTVCLATEGNSLVVKGTDLETAIRVKIGANVEIVDELWGIAIQPGSIGDTKANRRIDMTINTAQQWLCIDAEHGAQTIKGIVSDEFPVIAAIPCENVGRIDKPEQLKRAIAFVLESVGNDRGLFGLVYATVRGDELTLTSTDGYRVHRARLAIEANGLEYSAAIPHRSLKKLARLLGKERVAIYGNEDRIAFVCDYDNWELQANLGHDNAPEFEKVLTQEPIWNAAVWRGELARAAKVAALFSKRCTLRVQRAEPCSRMILTAESPELGDTTWQIDAASSLCPRDLAFDLNVSQLRDVLEKGKSTELTLRWEAPSLGIFFESEDGGVWYSALVRPVEPPEVPRPSLQWRIEQEERKQYDERREAETEYREWVKAQLGLEGIAAMDERERRWQAISTAFYTYGHDIELRYRYALLGGAWYGRW